jgi:hypothetical protein
LRTISYCGSVLSNGASLDKTSSNAGMPCSGDASSICGAGSALSLVYNSSKLNADLSPIGGASAASSSSAAPAASSSAAAASGGVGTLPSGFKSASTGLVAEGTNGRALTGAMTSSSDMTPAVCASYCSNLGFGISATEYSTECYCGNSLEHGAALDKLSSNGGMACGGDKSLTCGGGMAMTLIYDSSKFNADLSPIGGAPSASASSSSSSSAAASATSSSSAAPATSSSAAPSIAPVTLDNGFSTDGACVRVLAPPLLFLAPW